MSSVLGIPPCIGAWGSKILLALGIIMQGYLEVQDSHRLRDHYADVGGWEVFLSLGITTCGHLILQHAPDSGNCLKWVSGA